MGLSIVFIMPLVIAAGGLLVLGVAAGARLYRRFAGPAAEAEALRPGTLLFGGSMLVALLCTALNAYLYLIDPEGLVLLHPAWNDAFADLQILCFINIVGFVVALYLFKGGRARTE